jgi:predicted nucleic acid-binding protein
MDNEKMIIISDSSPLISLAVIRKLNILKSLYKEINVPTAVYEEVVKVDKPFSRELKLFLNDKIKGVKNKMAVEILLSNIGAGEAEAIVLALEQQQDIILIDDLKARKFAKISGLKVIGTMGILLAAKKEGMLKEIRPLLSKLLSNNIRISSKIIEITLQAAREI